jgi:hypothetical protein
MYRPIWIIAALALGGAVGAQPTQFRKAHQFVIECRAGQTVAVVATCVRASVGYADRLNGVLYGPDGTTLARSDADPGEALALAATPQADGFCLLRCDPGMNAFTLDCGDATWCVDLTDRERKLEVITHSEPLYFWVPEGLPEFTLHVGGEASTVTVVNPAGEVAARQDVPIYTEHDISIKNAAPGAWQVQFALTEDLSVAFPPEIPPLLFPRPITQEELDRFQKRPAMSRFDGRPLLTSWLLDRGPPRSRRRCKADG